MNRAALSLLTSLAVVFAITAPADEQPEPPPLLQKLGNRLTIAVAADSWSNLVAKVKPTFAWNGRDLLWVEKHGLKPPSFRMDCAYRYEATPGKIQWVLLETRAGDYDESYAQVMGNNLKGIARVVPEKPTSDHGAYDYAIVLAQDKRLGTVYEIGWQKLMANGTSLAECQRRLYLLWDRRGEWLFLGEGPEEYNGKGGSRQSSSSTISPQVLWTSTNGLPCVIHFLVENRDSEWAGEDDAPRPLRPDLVEYEEMILDGSSRAARRLSSRPYLRAQSGDTFDKLVKHFASWTLGWKGADQPKRQQIERLLRATLLRLNPEISPGNLAAGTKLTVPTYAEMVEAESSGKITPERPDAKGK